jgi:hypothetical protein
MHILGNIFYSDLSPKDSYILISDNQIITINEIKKAIDRNESNIQPFLFFNTQIFNLEGKRLKNILRIFGEITTQFNYDRISGVASRIYPLFNLDTRQLIANFYGGLFRNMTLGNSLLNAKKLCKSGLVISSFLIFGKPWNFL